MTAELWMLRLTTSMLVVAWTVLRPMEQWLHHHKFEMVVAKDTKLDLMPYHVDCEPNEWPILQIGDGEIFETYNKVYGENAESYNQTWSELDKAYDQIDDAMNETYNQNMWDDDFDMDSLIDA